MPTSENPLPLTDQQQRIVAHNHGPALVFAVAGAGKTTAMVHRVERLVRERIFAPQRILLSSFNKMAVDDLGKALQRWPHCQSVSRLTLHGLGYKIVRDAAQLGRTTQLAQDALKVHGEERQILWAARDLARQRGVITPGDLDALDEQDLLNYIGACKGNLCYADLAAADLPAAALTVARQAEAPPGLPWYLDLYRLFEEVRRTRGWLTFDDMLLQSWELLVRLPDMLTRWQQTYDALLIDEFQDVNLAQAELIDLLARSHGNLMAIGDDDQTIYGFRGASMSFFRTFSERYRATIYEMSDNFRCRISQVVLARKVIEQNRDRQPKALTATRGFGGETALRFTLDSSSMGRQMVADIQALQAMGIAGSAMVVLVRLTAQTPPLEQALIEADIPYYVEGEEPFFLRREIVDLLKYVELANYDATLRTGQRLNGNQHEPFTNCWRSLYNRPRRYLSRQFFQETVHAVLRQGSPLSEILLDLRDSLSERTAASVQILADLLVWLTDARKTLPASDLLRELDWRLGYQDFLLKNSGFAERGGGFAANVAAFIDYAQGKGTLEQFQAHLVELAAERRIRAANDPQAINIRTIHKAKGLEWPVVLVPNCNAGIIPVGGTLDLEEERRLLYVAITRAKLRLYLYAAVGGDAQLSPFLATAAASTILQRTAELEQMLTSDPLAWSAVEAVHLLTFPRLYGQERFFRSWWQPTVARERIAGRLLALAEALLIRDALTAQGITAADIEFWGTFVTTPDPTLAQPFADLNALCAPPGRSAAVPLSRKATYRVGDRVEHTQFGPGIVVAVEAGSGSHAHDHYLSIDFPSRGRVKLVAGIAPLRRIG